MSQEMRSSRSATRMSSAYLYSWVTVAVCGLAYVGVAATRPDLIGSVVPLAEQATDGGRASADMSDELATLRKWVHDMQHELAATRSAMQDQTQQTQTLLKRIAAAEDRLPPVRELRAEAAVPAPAPQRAAVPQRLKTGAQPPANTPAPSQPQQTAAADTSNLRVINVPDAAAPITTGSVAGEAQPVAKAPSPAQIRGVEIGNAESLDVLRARWGEISGRNGEVLGGSAPRYRLATDGRQSPFTLVTGPFPSPAEASKICQQLRAKGVACRVSDYSGSAF